MKLLQSLKAYDLSLPQEKYSYRGTELASSLQSFLLYLKTLDTGGDNLNDHVFPSGKALLEEHYDSEI